jgi:two-component system response regulator HydG
MKGRVLIVDDDPAMGHMLVRSLGKKDISAEFKTNADDALAAALAEDFDVVVTDIQMAGMNGLELCERIVANRPDVPVVVITAFGSLQTAISAIRVGAYDFIPKPVDVDALELVLMRAMQHRALGDEVKRLRSALEETRTHRFGEVIGASPAMRRLFALMDHIVDSDASVLITGESGTGKEVIARALHQRGARRGGPFVAVNCAALPEALLESELFGHLRGAFTGATADRKGLFVAAHRGTLFLDEIGEMPLAIQAKLLRALQERKVRPVGSEREAPFDVRLVTATNRDLESDIEEGRFRQDLFFRIDVVRLPLPPLRARGGDILLLAQHFLDRHARSAGKNVRGISAAAAGRLLEYSWPGNVRELENSMERAVAVTTFEQIVVEDLPERIRTYKSSHVLVASDDPTELAPMNEVERRYIERVLEAVGGNKTLAAKVLGFDRKTLYNKLERYELPKKGA